MYIIHSNADFLRKIDRNFFIILTVEFRFFFVFFCLFRDFFLTTREAVVKAVEFPKFRCGMKFCHFLCGRTDRYARFKLAVNRKAL